MAMSREVYKRIYGNEPPEDLIQPIMIGHVMFIISGRDQKGNFTSQWLYTDPVEPLTKVTEYLNTFPELEQVEMTIVCPDKDAGRSIRIR